MNRELEHLYRRSQAAEFGIAYDRFTSILAESAASSYNSLKVEDLVLARACVDANEKAWEVLVERYRPKLFRMACAIAKDPATAREISDSLFTDLFGIRDRKDGSRTSKLASYTGRASLESWLRAVLAQEYINDFRARRRLAPLDNIRLQEHPAEVSRRGNDTALAEALDTALAELSPEQRFLLAAHYLDERSFAELGRMLAVHETTVGRRMDKTLKTVRKRTLHHLRRLGLSLSAAEEALHCDVRDLATDVRSRLLIAREV